MDDEPRRTGKQMERLGVEDNLEEQASVAIKNKLSTAAKEAWGKVTVRGFLAGKKVRRGDREMKLDPWWSAMRER